jgi:hypothetical protein
MSTHASEVEAFHVGYKTTVRLDKNGDAYVIGLREPVSRAGDYKFRKTPDLKEVKDVVVGYDSVWFLKLTQKVTEKLLSHEFKGSANGSDGLRYDPVSGYQHFELPWYKEQYGDTILWSSFSADEFSHWLAGHSAASLSELVHPSSIRRRHLISFVGGDSSEFKDKD